MHYIDTREFIAAEIFIMALVFALIVWKIVDVYSKRILKRINALVFGLQEEPEERG